MAQLSLFQPQRPTSWSVTDLTQYLRELLESDHNLRDVWVRGEVSNLSAPKSGHLYFTLKDTHSSLRCVMWRSSMARQRFIPRDGDEVEVHGQLGIYEAGGQYQLYADIIRHEGEGAQYLEFLRLKALLEAEGLFDPERKRSLPALPRQIGIVTSLTGAAIQDMLNTIRRRYPLAEVVVAPTLVQGEQAPAEIVRGLIQLLHQAAPDVIILARGGGSVEDLAAFNDETLVRAVAACPVPVVTGIGHETDFTLADFAADQRAPTPTAAAELVTPDRLELHTQVKALAARLVSASAALLDDQRWQLAQAATRLRVQAPHARVQSHQQRMDELAYRLDKAIQTRLAMKSLRHQALLERLPALNPLGILGRGFALVTTVNGQVVRSTSQVQPGQRLHVRVADGQFTATPLEDSPHD